MGGRTRHHLSREEPQRTRLPGHHCHLPCCGSTVRPPCSGPGMCHRACLASGMMGPSWPCQEPLEVAWEGLWGTQNGPLLSLL